MIRYAVFGNPVHHSRSPYIHSLFAQQEQTCIQYDRIEVDIHNDEFEWQLRQFFNEGGMGANVTVPFKERAYQWVDELSERAAAAKAVNTLIVLPNQKIRGDNTDGIGLVQDITQHLYQDLTQRRILLLGAGGASRGVILPLLQCRPDSVTITNRTMSKAELLADEFQIEAVPFDVANQRQFDIVINATSSGLNGEIPPISGSLLRKTELVYDMLYGKTHTPFIQFAIENDSPKVADGLGMLVCQAAHAYFLWRNFMPDAQSVIQQLQMD